MRTKLSSRISPISARGPAKASTLGYQLSADYVASKMEAAGYEVTRQPFEYNFEELAAPTVVGTSLGFPFTYTDGEDISTMDYSGSGTVTGVVQGVNDNIVPYRLASPTARRTLAARMRTSRDSPVTLPSSSAGPASFPRRSPTRSRPAPKP